jgi:hypothetical protein
VSRLIVEIDRAGHARYFTTMQMLLAHPATGRFQRVDDSLSGGRCGMFNGSDRENNIDVTTLNRRAECLR